MLCEGVVMEVGRLGEVKLVVAKEAGLEGVVMVVVMEGYAEVVRREVEQTAVEQTAVVDQEEAVEAEGLEGAVMVVVMEGYSEVVRREVEQMAVEETVAVD